MKENYDFSNGFKKPPRKNKGKFTVRLQYDFTDGIPDADETSYCEKCPLNKHKTIQAS